MIMINIVGYKIVDGLKAEVIVFKRETTEELTVEEVLQQIKNPIKDIIETKYLNKLNINIQLR